MEVAANSWTTISPQFRVMRGVKKSYCSHVGTALFQSCWTLNCERGERFTARQSLECRAVLQGDVELWKYIRGLANLFWEEGSFCLPTLGFVWDCSSLTLSGNYLFGAKPVFPFNCWVLSALYFSSCRQRFLITCSDWLEDKIVIDTTKKKKPTCFSQSACNDSSSWILAGRRTFPTRRSMLFISPFQ